MTEYFNTRTFTLVPAEISSPQEQERIIRSQFDLSVNDIVRSVELQQYGARLVFSSNYTDENSVPRVAVEGSFPAIYKYILGLDRINDFNKAVLGFDALSKICFIAIAEGSKLVISNSYRSADFNSAMYFLLEALRQRQINPAQTSADIYGEISDLKLHIIQGILKNIRVFK